MGRFAPNVLSFILLSVATLGLATGLTNTPPASATAGATNPTWWKVDTHGHSSISGDARADLGVNSAKAQAAGYNAVFLTDHDRAASFMIQNANGNYTNYADILGGRWSVETRGTLSSFANSTVESPVHSGTRSLHVKAESSSSGRSFAYTTRAPSVRAGAVILDFWVYPQQISGNAGVDVSVALGGDATVATPYGYTNSAGTTTLGKSTVLVWQLGSARASSQSGSSRVYSNSLNYSSGEWNHYIIDVTSGSITWTPEGGTAVSSNGTGLDTLDPADRPAGHATLAYAKVEAAVTGGGTADAYIDDYVLRDSAPNCPAADFAYRNKLLNTGQFDGPNFKVFAGREMGQNSHSNQFNFGITDPADYFVNYNDTSVPPAYGNDGALCAATNNPSAQWKFSRLGSDNIPDIHASGYPAQNNHPGITDSLTNVVSTKAHGADAMEIQTSGDYSKTWDDILQQNHILMGTYGSDSHGAHFGGSTPTNYIDAPSLSLDALMHSFFEGRMYQAPADFAGRIVFNVDGGSRPYAARYPTLVPATASTADVHLSISGGLSSDQRIRWITNSGSGPNTTDIPIAGTSYEEVRSIQLTGSFTYVRAEIRDAADKVIANTQPIFFRSITGLPDDKSVRVDSVTPASGCDCNISKTRGITTASWATDRLTLNLTNPAGSTVNLLGTSAAAPSQVHMDGSSVSQSPSLGDFQAQTGDAWYYDPGTHQLYLQDHQGSATSSITVSFGTSATFSPAADARVLESNPTSNYGSSATLAADGGADPDVESYLRFTVTGVSGSVSNVKLRLHTTSSAGSASGNGPAVYRTQTSWTETGLTWSNRPARTTQALDDKDAIASNTWLEYDVTAAITGDGSYAFVVATSSADGTDLYSREATTFRPELIVTT